MEDQHPPGDAATAGDQQKPGEAAAMVEDQQKPDEAAAMEIRYPVEEVAEAAAFLIEITESLKAAAPGVLDGVHELLVGFGEGRGGDASAVASRVAGLLEGHPDVLRRFTAFVTSAKAPAVPPGPLAVTRPRRSKRDGRGCQSLPAVKEEPDAQDIRSPHKNEAGGAGGHGGGKRHDPRFAEAILFLKRLQKLTGEEVSDKFLDVLKQHAGDQFVDAIYSDAKDALGPAHADLLGELTSTFLPGHKEWEEQVRREAQRNRRRAAAGRRADDNNDGDHLQHGLRNGSESLGGRGTAARGESDQHATLEVDKKRRADDGDHRGHDDENYAPRFRTKKPRADNGGGHSRHAVRNNDDPSGGVVAAAVLDKKSRRRAPNGSEALPPVTDPSDQDALLRWFRELWVFYTNYSTLVGTIARVGELLHRDGGGGFHTLVEELFPRREHQELLGSCYGNHWSKMRAALEDGDSSDLALEAVLRRLKLREEEAVAEESRELQREDAARATERLVGLVVDRVRSTLVPGGDD